jgi:Concanavalin A-like lectin/glucanases superfamily
MADTYFNNVSLLLHFNGSNGSTTFTDSSLSAKTPSSVTGNVNINTAQYKFGNASAYFDGSVDDIRYADHADFEFGSGDFTVETWIRPSTVTGYHVLFAKCPFSGGYGAIKFEIKNTSLRLSCGSTGFSWDIVNNAETASSLLAINTWYHVAVTRSGNTFRIFLDGVNVNEVTGSGALQDNTAAFSIGTQGEAGTSEAFYGYMDDFRITKGIARYTANFTPPTEEFPNTGGIDHTLIGSTSLTVTPHSTLQIQWNHSLIGTPSIAVIPYSTKVYVTHSYRITGAVRIDVLPSATLASHATVNKAITGATTLSITPNSTKLWRTPNHFKTGAITISVTPTTSTWIRGQYQGGTAALVIPSLFAYSTGWKEEPNAAALVLPSLIGMGVGGGLASGTLPSLLITATGTQELHGSAEAILPGLYFEGTGQREYNGTATVVVPGFNASSYGAATAELILPTFTVSGTGTQEFGGKANCILPGLIIAATGQREYNGTAALVLPGLRGGDIARAALVMPGLFVSASGSVGFANSVGYILNVHSNESYQWSNMAFNHIIRIGTDYYGVKSTGLYKLSTAYTTDSGTAIDATIRTKETDFGSFHSKHLQYAYIGSDTSTLIQPIVDGIAKQSHASSFGGRRTRLALGNSGRYWALKISNITELTGLELLPQELQRRVK